MWIQFEARVEHFDIAWNRNGACGYSVGLNGKCGYRIQTAGEAHTGASG
jgi:hypothetical protein